VENRRKDEISATGRAPGAEPFDEMFKLLGALQQQRAHFRRRRVRFSRKRRFSSRELTKVVFRPWFWLVFQAGMLALIFAFSGKLNLHLPDNNSDDQDYLDWSQVPLSELISSPDYLGGHRTLGYPVFLKCVECLSPSFTALPGCQLALHILAVFAFYWGLRHIGFPQLLALASASSLLYADLILLNNVATIDGRPLTYIQCFVTDPVALSLAILTVGMLLGVISRPKNKLAWFGLTLGLFFTYQVRPAYLFLIPLVPLLGLLLLRPVGTRKERIRKRTFLAIGLVVVSSFPLLAFCAFRLAKFGHFGLTSFGGITSIHIVGQFLTDDLLAELPLELRPLALKALDRRKKLVMGEIPCTFPPAPAFPDSPDQLSRFVRWQPVTEKSQHFDSEQRLIQQLWIGSATGVDIFIPAATELYGPHDANSKLSQLSWAIIKARPSLYFTWVVNGFCVAVILALTKNFVFVVLTALLGLLFGLWLASYGVWFFCVDRQISKGRSITERGYSSHLLVVLLTASAFGLAKIILVILVNVPEIRYLQPAGVFLPLIPLVLIFAILRNIHSWFTGTFARIGINRSAATC